MFSTVRRAGEYGCMWFFDIVCHFLFDEKINWYRSDPEIAPSRAAR